MSCNWRRYELRPNPGRNEPILPQRLRLLSPGIMLARNCTKPACSRASRAQARKTTVVARAAVDANRVLSAGAATVAALALLGGCEGTLSSCSSFCNTLHGRMRAGMHCRISTHLGFDAG